MRLAQLIEQWLLAQRATTVRSLAARFGITEDRCRDELAVLRAYGVDVANDGQVVARLDD